MKQTVMKTVPIPRILEPLMSLPWNQPIFEASRSVQLRWDEGIYYSVIFLTDDIVAYRSGAIRPHFTKQGNGFNQLDTLTILHLHGHKPERISDRKYQCPMKASGNGLPVMCLLSNARVHYERNQFCLISADRGFFVWRDNGLGGENVRRDGPSTFFLPFLSLKQNSLIWTIPGELTEPDLPKDHILNRAPCMNPFRVPFFADPQDELSYLTETG